MMAILRKNSFVLLLLAAFVLTDLAVSLWDPMVTSRRFYKNDFTKTLYHHDWTAHGPVFYGNSAVTGAYIEPDAKKSPLIEMGLSYGKLTDLKAILEQERFRVEEQLVIGIDVHTMIDSLETDPTYQWFKKPYQPYLYAYRDYFRDSGTEFVRQLYTGAVELDPTKLLAYQPRWIDKELYFGHKTEEELRKKWADYDKRFGWMGEPDYRENLAALDWLLAYAKERSLPLRVVWMPWNRGYELPRYMPGLQQAVNARLQAAGVPVLDKLQGYDPRLFHDLVHLSRQEGAPVFTKEVDAWLASLAKSSK
ncbi:hypothetical protein ACVNS2_00740 [Paenibacillus caseinilyticus]|uniref:SGNH hydrolase-type esterase domain-containing protein n=1 Tax=Paenibacillus mucilaginosus K02 TaxID=997761 RepID=V9IR86_9BACL|nr:hypothetical protein [Paenibacillus mucilaginosus]AFK65298.1 hypothetical protein [Paenibacillus mucilaginosus K02]